MDQQKKYIYFISLVATVGGFLFGFDTAVIAGAIGFLKDHFQLNALEEGWAVSAVLVGCIFGAGFSGIISDRYGRKRVLFISAALFFISAIGAAWPNTITQFAVARFIGGLGIGAASVISPLYIAEIAPAQIRGRLVSLNQMAIVTGILIAYAVDWAFADLGPTNWRWMFGSAALPAIIFIALLMTVPESPRWLLKMGCDREAILILTRVNGAQEAQHESVSIRETLALESGSLKQLLQPGLRLALIVGIILAILQQVTGINSVIYYAPRIFEHAGFARGSALLQSVIVGLVNMIFAWVAILFVDKIGRKPLLLLGSLGMGFSLFLMGLSFYFKWFSGPWVLIMVMLYIAFFAMTLGPIVWVVIAEIFPTRIRGRAMSISTVALWIACFIVSLTFPIMADHLSESVTFWIYASMNGVCFLFVRWFVPETKNKTLEQIEKTWV
jgi:MFS transporter, SP family, arabinose:H+ symporter